MGSSSKLNYQIYKYILYFDMQNVYSTIYIHYLPAIEYTYLNLDVEAIICQSLKYRNTQIHMTPSVKY